MDRIESLFIQIIAISAVAIAAAAGMTALQASVNRNGDVPIVKLERVIVTADAPLTLADQVVSRNAG